MRVILAIIALAALAWTGWWFAIATAKEAALNAWLAERRAAGWAADAQSIDVEGFPYRVDTTVRSLDLANPATGWAWSAPEFQFLTLATQPNHLIAIFPPRQTVATPLGTTVIEAETLRASLGVEPRLDLALDRSTFEIANLTLSGSGDWRIGMESALLSTRQADGVPFSHDVSFSAQGLRLPENLLRGAVSGNQSLTVEATAAFDRPWDRPAIEGTPPRLQSLSLHDFVLTAGRLDLRGKGDLAADENGFATGRIDLRAREWRGMIDLAEAAGTLSSGMASALRAGLGLIASLGGDRDALETSLDFRDGLMFLGPVPVGTAPRLSRPAA